MSDEVVENGMRALKLDDPLLSPKYETNGYPSIPNVLRITFKHSTIKQYGQAQEFLRHEGIPFALAQSEKLEYSISIIGTKNTGLLYSVLNEFSSKRRLMRIDAHLPYSAAIADRLLWHIFGPWLMQALEVAKPHRSPTHARQMECFSTAVTESASQMLEEFGFDKATIQRMAENFGRLGTERIQLEPLERSR
jgi:hypothetical protein